MSEKIIKSEPVKEWLSTEQACQLYHELGYGYITAFPIIQLCKREGVGKKVIGRWKIDKKLFVEYLEKGSIK